MPRLYGYWLFNLHCQSNARRSTNGPQMSVSDLWQRMSTEEKNEWKMRARRDTRASKTAKQKQRKSAATQKEQTAGSSKQQEDDDGESESDHEPFVIIESAKEMEENRQFDCKHNIRSIRKIYDGKPKKRGMSMIEFLCDIDHAFVYIVPHCQSSDNYCCVPAEMAMVVFNLTDGIKHERHWLFPLPKDMPNYALQEAQARTNNHKVPLTAEGFGNEPVLSVNEVAAEIEELLLAVGVEGDFKGFLCASSPKRQFNLVQGALNWICTERANQKNVDSDALSPDQAWTIEGLVYSYMKMLSVEPDTKKIASNLAVGKALDARVRQWCLYHEYHTPSGIEFCALHCAKAVLYKVFEQLHGLFGFEITEAHRAPKMTAVDGVRTVTFAQELTDGIKRVNVGKDQPYSSSME